MVVQSGNSTLLEKGIKKKVVALVEMQKTIN